MRRCVHLPMPPPPASRSHHRGCGNPNIAAPGRSTRFLRVPFWQIEPTAMLRRVMDLQSLSNPARFGGREGFVERGGYVRVEVVHHQHDLLGSGVVHIDELIDAVRPVHFGVAGRHRYAAQRAPGRTRNGSQRMKRFAVPPRTYSQSSRSGCPGASGRGVAGLMHSRPPGCRGGQGLPSDDRYSSGAARQSCATPPDGAR